MTSSEAGGYVARWNDPSGSGITTQGDTLEELKLMIADALKGYFEPEKRPERLRLVWAGKLPEGVNSVNAVTSIRDEI